MNQVLLNQKTGASADASCTHDLASAGTVATAVTIVVPVFNEQECVSALLETLGELDADLGARYRFSFLIVDDGSTDRTAALIEEAISGTSNYRLLSHSHNQGIAAAIHTGVRNATSEVVVSIDADGSYDAKLIEQMVPLLVPGVDMVTASPYHPEGAVENVAAWRIWLSRCASGLYRVALKQRLYCYTSCFRVYRRSRVLDLEPESAGYVGVAELLWKLEQQGSLVAECPATLRTRIAGYSKMKFFRAMLRHLRLVTHICGCRIRGRFRRSPLRTS